MANGYFHGYNVLKLRTMRFLYRIFQNEKTEPPGWVTSVDLSEALGLSKASTTHMLSRYWKYGYVARSTKQNTMKKDGNKSYRWHITQKGINLMFELEHKVKRGYSLCRRPKYKNKKVDSYFGITKKGALEMGLKESTIKQLEINTEITVLRDKTDTFIEY